MSKFLGVDAVAPNTRASSIDHGTFSEYNAFFYRGFEAAEK